MYIQSDNSIGNHKTQTDTVSGKYLDDPKRKQEYGTMDRLYVFTKFDMFYSKLVHHMFES